MGECRYIEQLFRSDGHYQEGPCNAETGSDSKYCKKHSEIGPLKEELRKTKDQLSRAIETVNKYWDKYEMGWQIRTVDEWRNKDIKYIMEGE